MFMFFIYVEEHEDQFWQRAGKVFMDTQESSKLQ